VHVVNRILLELENTNDRVLSNEIVHIIMGLAKNLRRDIRKWTKEN